MAPPPCRESPGGTKQLFLGPWTEDGWDGHLVESMSGVTIRMNEARARANASWSRLPITGDERHERVLSRFCLPAVFFLLSFSACKFVTTDAEPGNNILYPNDDFPYLFSEVEGAWVFIDPDGPGPGEKYKMFLKVLAIRDNPSIRKEEDPRLDARKLPKCRHAFVSGDDPLHPSRGPLAGKSRSRPAGRQTGQVAFRPAREEALFLSIPLRRGFREVQMRMSWNESSSWEPAPPSSLAPVAADPGRQVPIPVGAPAGLRIGLSVGNMRSGFIRSMNEGGVEEWIRSHLGKSPSCPRDGRRSPRGQRWMSGPGGSCSSTGSMNSAIPGPGRWPKETGPTNTGSFNWRRAPLLAARERGIGAN